MNELLQVSHISATYNGTFNILHDISFSVARGEIVAIMGPNGCGKTTALKAMFGLAQKTHGEILFNDSKLEPVPHNMIKMGIAYVPQGRRTFTRLSVRENLEMGGYFLKDKTETNRRIEEVLRFFPALRTKLKEKSGSLSGGQQQMLAIARGLMTEPRLLLLDEPTLGLSPKVVSEMFEVIKTINQEQGTAMLIVEHNIKSLLPIVNRVYVFDKGEVVFHGTKEQFQNSSIFEKVFLGLL